MKIRNKRPLITILFATLFAFCLPSCQEDKSYSIEGTIYGGRNFEDQTIYLVPFSGGASGGVDSARIHDSRFRFDGLAEKDEICILRMRPMMRLFIDEVLLVREAGHIHVKLSEHSSASGTPLNDSLQSWREYKQALDAQLEDIKKKMRRATPEELAELTASQDSIKNLFDKRNRASAAANGNNAFGGFLDNWIIR